MPLLASATVDRQTLIRRGVLALVLSLVANWLILGVVLLGDLVSEFRALAFPPVTILTAMGVVGAVIAYALVDRGYRNPNPLFVRLATITLVLSFLPDLAVLAFDEAATVGAVLVMMTMHVPPALACILSLTGRLSELSG
jgi:hypothetical protein